MDNEKRSLGEILSEYSIGMRIGIIFAALILFVAMAAWRSFFYYYIWNTLAGIFDISTVTIYQGFGIYLITEIIAIALPGTQRQDFKLPDLLSAQFLVLGLAVLFNLVF